MLVLGAASACRRAPEETPDPTPPPSYDAEVYGELETLNPHGRVIVLWYSYTGDEEALLLRMIDQFNTSNRWRLTVIGEYAGASDELYEALLSRIATGRLPDIVLAEPHHTAAYAMQDGLVALDPYLESQAWGYTEDELADFLPPALDAERLPQFDRRYSWPLALTTEVMYYNQDWLIELGYTDPPQSWETFSQTVCLASDADAYGFQFSPEAATFSDMLASRGGQMLSEEADEYAFGGDAGLATISFLQHLFRRECAGLKSERFEDREGFGAGRVLFTIGSTTELPQYSRIVDEGGGFDWSVMPLPTTVETPTLQIQGPVLSVFRSTPQKQLAAWLFLKWLTEPAQQARWAQTFSTFPVRWSAQASMTDYLAQNVQYAKALGFLEGEVMVTGRVTGYDACRASIEDMLFSVARPDEGAVDLSDAVEACNASLSEVSLDGDRNGQ